MNRPRKSPTVIQGQIVHGEKVINFINKPLHIMSLELIKTVTPAGKITLRKEEETVYHTRMRNPQIKQYENQTA